MANKHMKRCPKLPIIREMKITTTLRYHFISINIATINKTKEQQQKTTHTYWWNVGKLKPLSTVGGNANSTAAVENTRLGLVMTGG